MIIRLDKNSKPEEINQKLESLAKNKRKSMAEFSGKLKGVFGDGLTYQKKVRNEWS
jgi:hypothetical protein